MTIHHGAVQAGDLSTTNNQPQGTLHPKTKTISNASSDKAWSGKTTIPEKSGSSEPAKTLETLTGNDTQSCTVVRQSVAGAEAGQPPISHHQSRKTTSQTRPSHARKSRQNDAAAQNGNCSADVAEENSDIAAEAAAEFRDRIQQSIVIAWLRSEEGCEWQRNNFARSSSVLLGLKEDVHDFFSEDPADTTVALWWIQCH